MRCRRPTARVAWRTVAGRPITAPPLAHAGWVIVAAAGDLIAIRAADGVVLWRKPLGPIEFRPALDGDLLVASLVDGRLVALNLKDGSERWTANLRASPGEPFAIGGTVYVGTRDKIFYAIIAASGRIEDHAGIGGPLARPGRSGRPARVHGWIGQHAAGGSTERRCAALADSRSSIGPRAGRS